MRNANRKIQSVYYDRLVPYATRPLNMDRDIDLSWDISKHLTKGHPSALDLKASYATLKARQKKFLWGMLDSESEVEGRGR